MDRRTFLKAIGAGLIFPGTMAKVLSKKQFQKVISQRLVLTFGSHEILPTFAGGTAQLDTEYKFGTTSMLLDGNSDRKLNDSVCYID